MLFSVGAGFSVTFSVGSGFFVVSATGSTVEASVRGTVLSVALTGGFVCGSFDDNFGAPILHPVTTDTRMITSNTVSTAPITIAGHFIILFTPSFDMLHVI